MLNMTNAQATEALKSATKGINAAFAHCGRFADPDVALDLAQESIVNVLESYKADKATDNGINGYSFRVGYREALDYLRGRTSGGAQRRHDGEMSVSDGSDDDGNPRDLEIASPYPDAFDQLATMERDAMLACEIAALPESQRNALRATISEGTSDNTTRQAKMRAINTIVDNLPRSMTQGAKRSKAKGSKRK